MNRAADLDAGGFSGWLDATEAVLATGAEARVPCDGCTACCTSSQFVHIAPDETETLARIPPALLFPAPGLPAGHQVLGYDGHGRCPLLGDGGCSIYPHRPRTCRTYDCRVLAAAGVETGPGQEEIGQRARRWAFRYSSPDERARQDAVRAAARFLGRHPEILPAHFPGTSPTARAVLAVEIHPAFLGREPDTDSVRAEVERRTRRGGGHSESRP